MNDFRNDTKESDPMEVDRKGKGKGRRRRRDRGRGSGQSKGKSKSKSKSKSKGAKPGKQDKECYVCGKKGHFARDRWSRANQDRIVNEVEDAKVDSDAGTEFVRTSSKIFEPKWLRNSLRRFGDDRQRSLSQYLTQVVWRIGS